MNLESIDAAFTEAVRYFLERKGFSHIFSIGMYPNEMKYEDEAERGKENYWLEPVRPDDPRLAYAEAGHILNKINDADVLEMITSNDKMNYMIQIPREIYKNYVKKRKAFQKRIFATGSSYYPG